MKPEQCNGQQWLAPSPISSAEDLRRAVRLQSELPVRPLGEVLQGLKLISTEQLDAALKLSIRQSLPLGEHLVSSGLISRAELKYALLLKMNYPIVDLLRFEYNTQIIQLLTYDRAVQLGVLPLDRDDRGRLIIAMDDPIRLPEVLGPLRLLLNSAVIAVLPYRDRVARGIEFAYHRGGIAGSSVNWFG